MWDDGNGECGESGCRKGECNEMMWKGRLRKGRVEREGGNGECEEEGWLRE